MTSTLNQLIASGKIIWNLAQHVGADQLVSLARELLLGELSNPAFWVLVFIYILLPFLSFAPRFR